MQELSLQMYQLPVLLHVYLLKTLAAHSTSNARLVETVISVDVSWESVIIQVTSFSLELSRAFYSILSKSTLLATDNWSTTQRVVQSTILK